MTDDKSGISITREGGGTVATCRACLQPFFNASKQIAVKRATKHVTGCAAAKEAKS